MPFAKFVCSEWTLGLQAVQGIPTITMAKKAMRLKAIEKLAA
jgi:hypothetical protein